ncbi:hypothetical protein JQK87_14745 [Streptomyces sp. G44]|nr:hypothetical protein [Streptomyces sp. G44]
MEATGVSFAEQQMRGDRHYGQPPFPSVPGYDLVGTVLAAGPGVTSSLVGRWLDELTRHDLPPRLPGSSHHRHDGAPRGGARGPANCASSATPVSALLDVPRRRAGES